MLVSPGIFWRKDTVDHTTRVDNEVALAWLGNSLEYAHNQGQGRLAELLASVQAEIVFEMTLGKNRRMAKEDR